MVTGHGFWFEEDPGFELGQAAGMIRRSCWQPVAGYSRGKLPTFIFSLDSQRERSVLVTVTVKMLSISFVSPHGCHGLMVGALISSCFRGAATYILSFVHHARWHAACLVLTLALRCHSEYLKLQREALKVYRAGKEVLVYSCARTFRGCF